MTNKEIIQYNIKKPEKKQKPRFDPSVTIPFGGWLNPDDDEQMEDLHEIFYNVPD